MYQGLSIEESQSYISVLYMGLLESDKWSVSACEEALAAGCMASLWAMERSWELKFGQEELLILKDWDLIVSQTKAILNMVMDFEKSELAREWGKDGSYLAKVDFVNSLIESIERPENFIDKDAKDHFKAKRDQR